MIRLRSKVFETLRALVENAGRLLTKQQLVDAVWPNTSVEENNLNHNVSVLRKALGEKATGQRFIETVPRVGYRFAAAVEIVEPRRFDHASLGGGPPPAGTSSWLSHTTFVGRERELAELGAIVAGCRLLTITGAGGSGKTRLACEAAQRVQGAFPDGARLVALASIDLPVLVAQAALEAVGAPDVADRAPLEALAAALQHKRTLLVFDNCEHLIEEVASVVGFLLARVPGLHVVATSREALGLAGERVWSAPPLSLLALHCDEVCDVRSAYHFLADCALMRGDVATAREHYAESLRAALRYGDRLEASYEIEGVAMALAGQGRDERALRLAGAAAAELEALGSTQTMRFWEELKRRYLDAAAQRLAAGAAAARAAGRALGFEGAVAEALDPGA